jgi:phasin family protein
MLHCTKKLETHVRFPYVAVQQPIGNHRMAETKTDTAAPKADAPATAVASNASAPAPAVKAADAAPKTAAEAAAKAARSPARKPARRAAAARRTTKTAAPQRRAAPAAPARAARTAARATTNRINQGTQTMKNEAKQAADRFQAVFGDVNAQAKTAIERNSRIAEELTELTQGNVEAFVASTKVAAKGVETIGQEVAEFGRKSFEGASNALKSFAEVKSPTDFFRLQAEFVRNQFDSAVAESSKLSETVLKLAGEAAQPLTSRASVAAERVRSAVAF